MNRNTKAKPTKIVTSWTNDGHRKRISEEWVEGFILGLTDLVTREHHDVAFHTPIATLVPLYSKRRLKNGAGEKE